MKDLPSGASGIFSVCGSAYGEASLTGPDRIDATWYSAKLIGFVPEVGKVLFTTRPDIVSTVSIMTKQKGLRAGLLKYVWKGHSLIKESKFRNFFFSGFGGRLVKKIINALFFPAVATQDMYYDVQVLEGVGRENQILRCSKAVNFQAEITSIPPLGTTFHTLEDVDFYDLSNGSVVFCMEAGSPGLVNEAPGLEVDLMKNSFDKNTGYFEGTFSIKAKDKCPSSICWFATPVFGTRILTQEMAIDVPFDGFLDVKVSASVNGAFNRAGLIFQCFSSQDPPMEMHRIILFENQPGN